NVYIGAIQNFTTKQEDKFSKNMDRFLRKVNSGVPDDSIESNVSPKALVSMVIFMEYACSLGAEYASAYNYLPLRYSSKLGVINAKAKNVNNGEVQSEKTTNGENNSEIKLITEDRNNADVCQTFFDKLDADQYNITNKFMYLFARINHHFSSAKTEFSEIGCKINLNLENSEERNDNIIYNILNSAKKSHMEK
ncbi:MAG: hypothetical protein IJT25_01280, partial [Clostridia bacterium]|nr:hypothetical protein [Clostridia bacterium]